MSAATVRQERVTTDKLARATTIATLLGSVPFVRLMAVGNSITMGTATELSDIDFFVVTAPGRLWTARFLLLMKAKWLGLTKRPGKTADQADLGFWVDETTLDLSVIALRIAPSSEESVPTSEEGAGRIDDPYLERWLATLIPLVDHGGVYGRLIAANMTIVGTTLARNHELRIMNYESSLEHLLGGWVGEPIEWLLFVIQRWKVWADPVAHRPNPLTVYDRRVYPEHRRRVDVVTTRSMLKLHHLDQRAKYRHDRQR